MKVQHRNIMELPEETLMALTKETPLVESEHGQLKYISRNISHHGKGYYNDLVVFECEGKAFRFQATNYLDDLWSFTKPVEVFKETIKRTDTIYTTWVEVDDDSL